MIKLQDIFSILNYESEAEKLALAHLLLSCDIFNNPVLNHQTERRKKALMLWEKTGVAAQLLQFQSPVLSNSSPAAMLNITFPNEKLGLDWLVTMTQWYFLREEFRKEGIGQEKEKTGINIKQWKYEKSSSSDQDPLFENLRTLGFTKQIPWPKDTIFNHVVLLGSLEEFIIQRMNFLEDFEGCLYYLTGPRGLFNFETSLATILAEEWFNLPQARNIIQNVLDKYCEPTSPKQWCSLNLSGLKKEIVQALGLESWPQALHSYYYKDKETYDKAAQNAGRPLLGCEGGAWPVAADMVFYHLKQIQKHKNILKKVSLHPVIAFGKNNRLASSVDTLELWYEKYGKELLQNNPCLFAADNNSYSLPFLGKIIENNLKIQSNLCDVRLLNQLKKFISAAQFTVNNQSTSHSIGTFLVGPTFLSTFNCKMALSNLAKSIYTQCKNREALVHDYQFKQTNSQRKHTYLSHAVAKMIHYHHPLHLLHLSMATFELAQLYKNLFALNAGKHNGHLIKTIGLFSYIANIIEKTSGNRSIIDAISEAIILTMHDLIRSARNRIHCDPNGLISLNDLRELTRLQHSSLENIRLKLFNQCKKTTPNNPKQINRLYENCHALMKVFYTDLIGQAAQLLDLDVSRFSLLIMGSHARHQATPYSDLEFAILVEDENQSYWQAKELTKLLLLFVLSFRETLLPALGIVVTDACHQKIDLIDSIFDTNTRQGLAFDSNIPQASKTPLGKKEEGNIIFRLIGTPKKLASLASIKGYKKDMHLPQLLRLSSFLCGNENLYKQFLLCLNKDRSFKPSLYGYALLGQDLRNFSTRFEAIKKMSHIRHDKFFVKPPTIIMDDLYLMMKNGNVPLPNKLKFLTKNNLISKEVADTAKQAFPAINYLRFTQHCLFKRHSINIPVQDPSMRKVTLLMTKIFSELNHKMSGNVAFFLMQEEQLCRENIDFAAQLSFSMSAKELTKLFVLFMTCLLEGLSLLKKGSLSIFIFNSIADCLFPSTPTPLSKYSYF